MALQNPNIDRYQELLEATFKKMKHLAEVKGGEYAGDFDRLANFRRNGHNLGQPMELIWAVYAAKHWDALIQYVQDISHDRERPRAESIEGRVLDLMVYLSLFLLITEERNARNVAELAPATEPSVGFRNLVPKDFSR